MARIFMKGCEAIAEAAVRAGCRFFAGYPITPQNEIPEYFARRMPEVGGTFVQGESEVASVNMVYGAASAGTRSMTSSSSCGIALKSEGISYCASARIPMVYCNVQRGGPGVGAIQPAQQDYNQATKASGNGGFRMEDAEIVLTAYGICGRIAANAVDALREQGVKAGMIRPITVYPFPYAAYDKIDYTKCKGIVSVEMSIPAQFADDVKAAVKERCAVTTCLCSGGNIMSREAVLETVKKVMEC